MRKSSRAGMVERGGVEEESGRQRMYEQWKGRVKVSVTGVSAVRVLFVIWEKSLSVKINRCEQYGCDYLANC